MINKEAIAYVWPEDTHWMTDAYTPAPGDLVHDRRRS
jgi:hypothetical protein